MVIDSKPFMIALSINLKSIVRLLNDKLFVAVKSKDFFLVKNLKIKAHKMGDKYSMINTGFSKEGDFNVSLTI